MNDGQYQIESLVDSNQEQDNKPPEQTKLKYYMAKPKNIDLYQSLLSTYLRSELCERDGMEDQDEDCEIDVLEYVVPVVRRKRGRPKKYEKVEDQYEAENDEDYDFDVTLSKNKKKKQKHIVKGTTKNLFNFFHRLVVQYLSKNSKTEQISKIRSCESNRYHFFSLLKNENHQQKLKEMFETRYLNREVVASNRLSTKNLSVQEYLLRAGSNLTMISMLSGFYSFLQDLLLSPCSCNIKYGYLKYKNIQLSKSMFQGLNERRHFLLTQISDPLKYCNYALPLPMPIGLPFMPCDLPNQYKLYETDENYSYTGDQILTFEEEVGLVERILIPASHRPWKITGKDYYNDTPYMAFRNLNICLSPSDRPEVKVYMHEKKIGKIRETTILNCCCITQKFQQFQIFNNHDQLIYRVTSKNPQRGHFLILPFCNFNKIHYQILKICSRAESLSEYDEQSHILQEHLVGEIVHLFNGFAEYTSKNDKYGITLPVDACQEEKCLLIHCGLFIDYLLFQNF